MVNLILRNPLAFGISLNNNKIGYPGPRDLLTIIESLCFPKPWTKIKRTYICPVVPDSTEFDYLFSDSLYIEMPFDYIGVVLENDSVGKAVKEVFD